jgi:hypothetical protein
MHSASGETPVARCAMSHQSAQCAAPAGETPVAAALTKLVWVSVSALVLVAAAAGPLAAGSATSQARPSTVARYDAPGGVVGGTTTAGQSSGTSQTAPSGGTRSCVDASSPCHGTPSATTVPRFPTPEPP